MVKEQEERPEDCIPETEQNREAREFLANAPKKGLWMPLGKEVKVMQCKFFFSSLIFDSYSLFLHIRFFIKHNFLAQNFY